ncbi:MAG: PIG-L family deacetylase [Ornithinibacter sp.]
MTSPLDEAFTVVAFHAHPDDEALLTAGTLARAVAEGHRVVLVVATNGEAGLSADIAPASLGSLRLQELLASAAALGVARTEALGYPDSGSTSAASAAFSTKDPDPIARELARILIEERADVLTTYDAAGGYGHPDHLQVHRVGAVAAQLAGTPILLEATLDRTVLVRVVGVMRLLSRILPTPRLPDMSQAFTERSAITHRVDVRAYLPAKRASLAAHASQAQGGPRTLRLLLALPHWLQSVVLGTEFYREVGRCPTGRTCDDIFDTLRGLGESSQREQPPSTGVPNGTATRPEVP